MVQTPQPAPSPCTTGFFGYTNFECDETRVGAHDKHTRRTRQIACMGRRVSESHAGSVASGAMAGSDMGLKGERKKVCAGLGAQTRSILG